MATVTWPGCPLGPLWCRTVLQPGGLGSWQQHHLAHRLALHEGPEGLLRLLQWVPALHWLIITRCCIVDISNDQAAFQNALPQPGSASLWSSGQGSGRAWSEKALQLRSQSCPLSAKAHRSQAHMILSKTGSAWGPASAGQICGSPVGDRDAHAPLAQPCEGVLQGLAQGRGLVLQVAAPEDAVQRQVLHQGDVGGDLHRQRLRCRRAAIKLRQRRHGAPVALASGCNVGERGMSRRTCVCEDYARKGASSVECMSSYLPMT